MVNLFGDWFNDLAAIVFVFVIYCIYRIWLSKDHLQRQWALIVSSAIIFVISIFPIFSNIFFGDSNLTTIEGEYILIVIAAIALLTVIFGLKRIYPSNWDKL